MLESLTQLGHHIMVIVFGLSSAPKSASPIAGTGRDGSGSGSGSGSVPLANPGGPISSSTAPPGVANGALLFGVLGTLSVTANTSSSPNQNFPQQAQAIGTSSVVGRAQPVAQHKIWYRPWTQKQEMGFTLLVITCFIWHRQHA